MISSLKIKLNHSWKFWRNWNVPLVLLERPCWWGRFYGIYLERFGSRMWDVLIFKWFLPLKISNKFQKTRFLEGKISWGRGNTRRLTTQFKHDFLSYLAVWKIDTYIACPPKYSSSSYPKKNIIKNPIKLAMLSFPIL